MKFVNSVQMKLDSYEQAPMLFFVFFFFSFHELIEFSHQMYAKFYLVTLFRMIYTYFRCYELIYTIDC